MVNKRQTTAREKLKSQNKSKDKEKFILIKMWLHYLLSMFEKDRGKIPDNIGNRILITNNVVITKCFMTSFIQITELSMDTPTQLIDAIQEELKNRKSNAFVDVVIKNNPFDVRLKDTGLESRINIWEKNMNRDDIADVEKERAARCLYTVDKVREGNSLYKSRIYLKVRAMNGTELTNAEKIIYNYLTNIGATYLPVSGDVKKTLKYTSLVADHYSGSIKDVKAIVTSMETLSQMLPNTNAYNGNKGLYIGVNIQNNSEFNLDLENITVARNIYLIAPSGEGKSVIAANMVMSALEQPNWTACIMDIKGNEFNTIVDGVGGYIVSLRPKATEYINSFVLHPEDTTDENASTYYYEMFNFSKLQMKILSGISDQDKLVELEEFLDEFLNSVYVSLGVLPTNRNTWHLADNLDPFVIYEYILGYMTEQVQKKYSLIAKTLLSNLRMYWSYKGSKSYAFKREFEYANIIKAPALSFDFGILENSTDKVDMQLFKLKFAYMRKLNSEYITYKHSKGIKVLKVLEESQIVDDDIMMDYVEEWTLRRSQGQSNLLLGNSVKALENNRLSGALIENTKALLIGKLTTEALDTVVSKFGLEDIRQELGVVGSDPEYSNSFMFVNRMEADSLTPVIKVILDKNHEKPKKPWKFITPVKQHNNMVK